MASAAPRSRRPVRPETDSVVRRGVRTSMLIPTGVTCDEGRDSRSGAGLGPAATRGAVEHLAELEFVCHARRNILRLRSGLNLSVCLDPGHRPGAVAPADPDPDGHADHPGADTLPLSRRETRRPKTLQDTPCAQVYWPVAGQCCSIRHSARCRGSSGIQDQDDLVPNPWRMPRHPGRVLESRLGGLKDS
jgi:hypothetical protein